MISLFLIAWKCLPLICLLTCHLHADFIVVPLLLDSENNIYDDDALFTKMVIVTAIMEEQLNDGLQLVASAQSYMPNTTIIVYNIGLRDESVVKASYPPPNVRN